MSSQEIRTCVAHVRHRLFSKFRGGELPLPPRPTAKVVLLAWLGGAIAISAVAGLTSLAEMPLVLGSFGATCVLVFGYPDVPFSQPRNIVFGHVLSSLVGLICLTVFGPHWWAAGIATGTAIAVMMLTRTVHPPAGSNPVIVFLSQPGWSFLLYPTLAGASIIMILAVLYNNATRPANYPKYW
ncbi:HPP family protein [Verminephrobacter eiseniae]|uniref:HPP family protein n=1 Tax=Verminephrobacter eiseniae TaxID=364317 RepID=UPI002236F586|nr:HPP family protein [Verminephrobacter eiseniae]MCW5238006.1 HPP family protein [Verminephrobacter eiseniae]